MSTQTTSNAIVDTQHVEEHDAEGNSIAAWTAVVIMLAAFAGGTAGFCAELPIVVWIAVGVEILGALTGLVLKKMGYGVGGHRYVPKAHS